MKKVGRKKYTFDLNKDDCIFVYNLFKEVHQGIKSIREGAQELEAEYGISNTTSYRVFNNLKIMQVLIEHNIDKEVLEELDKELKVLDVIRLGEADDR